LNILERQKPRSLNINDFSSIRISLASPEKIRSWSHGEVKKPETINYRTFKPEKDGLFCAKIFGPVNDWECLCGKYKKMKHKGVVCEKCGVEVTLAKVRRERLGHIELVSPVSHVWFFKGLPSRIGQLLNLSLKDLERILYFESYVVIETGKSKEVKDKELITVERYYQLRAEHGDVMAMMGAEAIKELLKRVDVEKLSRDLRKRMRDESSVQKKLKFAKQLRVVEAFRKSGNRPEWMILDVIPVLPPDLRPLVPLDGGRFATSDLNDLYRRVINRNNRLRKLLELKAPDVIIRNEKRMLQEAVDALFDNGRRGKILRGTNNRPLKSLSDALKGKQGRFRQNLLGKRVDYSGRSVIVVGPELKLHQCGLPKKMAIELFKPFIFQKLEEVGASDTIKRSKEMVEQEEPIVWEILEEVIKDHPILLNRAPTLHRLGIQAFQPVLVDGKAIKIHPLVCAAFNADFDGDQMAVHVPLSVTAQIEASTLMISTNNLLSPAHGSPLAVPSQDMVLGIYYLTNEKEFDTHKEKKPRSFSGIDEVILAYDNNIVRTHDAIELRLRDAKYMELPENDQDILHADIKTADKKGVRIKTTVGRVIFNSHLPSHIPFINGALKKKGMAQLVHFCFLTAGNQATVEMLDELKDLGFLYATKAGISIGIEDLEIPSNKNALVAHARKEVEAVEQQYLEGAITKGEKYNKVVDIWTKVTEKIAIEMIAGMRRGRGNEFNSIYLMADSGARGSSLQIRQLAGMRGLMAKPSGEIIETPITTNFREGLSVLQYFISTHGARKGLADTALKTADSGYLTRRLVDVAQDVIVNEEDCGTVEGIYVGSIVEGGEIIEPLRDRTVGRVAQENVRDPFTGELYIKMNHEIDEDISGTIQNAGIERVKIRSVLTCESRRGVCARCYGRNLASGHMAEIGEAVGIIAAQSIGEPGTQLTMRTFHIGGTASRIVEQNVLESRHNGIVRFRNLLTVKNKDGFLVVMNRNGSIVIQDEEGRDREKYSVVYGAKLKVTEGQEISKGEVFVEWDPYSSVILTDESGTAEFKDIQFGLTMNEEVDEVSGHRRLVIIESPDEKMQPTIVIRDKDGKIIQKYPMPSGAHLMVSDKAAVHRGDVLAKIPRETTKTKDITGGLPRVIELFEARRPKEPAVITEVDGTVKYGGIVKGQRKIIVAGDGNEQRDYSLPRGANISVRENERVRAGEPLMDGPINPHDILGVMGEKALQNYLVNEIQQVYRLQNVTINDKHIEVIVRQMMRWVRIEDVGDTEFLFDETVDKFLFREENDRVLDESGRPAKGRPVLLGITKASLSTESFISAASFQETTRVLTEASITGSEDFLRGLKENVIMGRLIPAGTGMPIYRQVRIADDPTIPEFGLPVHEDLQMQEHAMVTSVKEQLGWTDEE
jgi:DNA-directed RNA polymerase subunit beta'